MPKSKKMAKFLGIKILLSEYVGILLTINIEVINIVMELKTA